MESFVAESSLRHEVLNESSFAFVLMVLRCAIGANAKASTATNEDNALINEMCRRIIFIVGWFYGIVLCYYLEYEYALMTTENSEVEFLVFFEFFELNTLLDTVLCQRHFRAKPVVDLLTFFYSSSTSRSIIDVYRYINRRCIQLLVRDSANLTLNMCIIYRPACAFIGLIFLSIQHENNAFTQTSLNQRISQIDGSASASTAIRSKSHGRPNNTLKRSWSLLMAKRSSEEVMSQPWLPDHKDDDDIFAVDEGRQQLERKSIQYLASLIREQLKRYGEKDDYDSSSDEETEAMEFAHDRFRDLTCRYEGELALERLFDTRKNSELEENDTYVIRGAVIALQSLAVFGMQVGVKGTPAQKERSVAHLRNMDDNQESKGLSEYWNSINSKRLKHRGDVTAGTQLLAELKGKRTAQSAFDLMVRLGAWKKHEDLALLRSGFPTRFTKEEDRSASEAAADKHDPDRILGIRKDLRHLKVFTIDSEYTDEIDDGLSIETIQKPDGSERKRIWIHIADADRWGKSEIIGTCSVTSAD